MLTYLIFIAALNTALGFVLAVHLLPPAAWVGSRPRFPLSKLSRHARPTNRKKATETDSPEEATDVAPDDADPPTAATNLPEAEAEDGSSGVEPPPDGQLDTPSATDTHDQPVEQIPPNWLNTLDEHGIQAASLVEASAQVLRLEVTKYRDHLVRIDARVRTALGSVDAGTMRLYRDELRQVNEEWLAKQSESTDHLATRAAKLSAAGKLVTRLLEVLQHQQAQIETTINNMNEFDIDGDADGSARRMVVEVRELLDLAHRLRDRMLEMLLEIKKTEDRLNDIDRSMSFDNLTKLHNRAGLEKVLHEHFIADRARPRLLSCALIDIDRFTNLMDKHGPVICDRILVAAGQLLSSLMRKDRGFDLLARYDGQRFFALMGDTGPRGGLSAAERMRQTIEGTTFDNGDQLIELTIRGGVAELGPDETAESFFGRIESALDAAKLAGRNCTRLDEGDGPKKIEAPKYELPGRIIPLA